MSYLGERAASVAALRRDIEADGAGPIDETMASYFDRPVEFVREVLGFEPWSRQVEVLSSMRTSARVAVRSGHKIGKSTIAAALALWWVSTRPSGRVVMTSASTRQVRSILWRELRRLMRRARTPIGGQLHEQPESGLQFIDGREVVGFSTDQPERMAGISGDQLLFIIDEASGVDETIFEAIEGNRAGGASVIMFSNPTRTSGYFYEAFTRKAAFWLLLHVSSLESPNVEAGRVVVPGLATREWIDEKREEWGESSPVWSVRVAGEFPSESSNGVIPLAVVMEATQRPRTWNDDQRLELGVDVARFGEDETVIVARRGDVAGEAICFRGLDVVEVSNKVLEIARSKSTANERPLVKVDVIGIGAGVADILRRNQSVEVIDVNVSESSSVETYEKRRDELWFGLRDWLRKGGSIPADGRLEAELVGPTYYFTDRGRVRVESKDDMRKRINRSPDRADALALAVYQPRGLIALTALPLERGPYARIVRTARTDNWGRPL